MPEMPPATAVPALLDAQTIEALPAAPPRSTETRTIGVDRFSARPSSVSNAGVAAERPGRFWAPTTPLTGHMNPSPPETGTVRGGAWAPTTPATGHMNPSPPGP